MTKSLLLSFLFAMLSQANAQTVGFGAADFYINPISGVAGIRCDDGAQTLLEKFDCRDERLSPFELAYFNGPKGVVADSLNLVVRREDGSVREKNTGYDNRNFRSDARLNLWLTSLLQRPLLAEGYNTIEYKLTKAGNVVSQGKLTVRVVGGERFSCLERMYHSNRIEDCQNSYQLCQRYFSEQNYCKRPN